MQFGVLNRTTAKSCETLNRDNCRVIGAGAKISAGVVRGGFSFSSLLVFIGCALYCVAFGITFLKLSSALKNLVFFEASLSEVGHEVLSLSLVDVIAGAAFSCGEGSGMVTVRGNAGAGAMYLFSAVWLVCGQWKVAVSWLLMACLFPVRRGGYAAVRCGAEGVQSLILGLFFFVVSPIKNGICLLILFLSSDYALEWGERGKVRSMVVDQTGVRVDNGGSGQTGRTADELFARRVVFARYDGVPREVLALVTRVPGPAGSSAAFRRWAQLGDTVLQLCVVERGVAEGQSVEVISNWKQCLNRKSMASIMLSTEGARERMTGVNGMVATQVAAECVEALVGVSYYYAYSCGGDRRWKAHFTSFINDKLM